MLAAGAGLAGVMLTALLAWLLDTRREARRREAKDEEDVWGAINSIREDNADNAEDLAEIRGLLQGLYAELVGDPAIVGKAPHRRRQRET